MTDSEFVSVLVVGGGVSGLSAAAFLAHKGVSCLLVEQFPGHYGHPRMSGATSRSMELFRELGLEPRIRELDEKPAHVMLRVDTLAGNEFARIPMGGEEDVSAISPCPQAWCDQDQLEPLVRERAQELGAEIRFNTELIGLDQSADEVRGTLRDRDTGSEYTVAALYVLACDGSHSTIRDSLGVSSHGPGLLAHQIRMLFRADLTSALRGRSFVLSIVDAGDGETGIMQKRALGRWSLGVPYHPERGERPAEFDEARCVELVRSAVGDSALPVEVFNIKIFRLEAMVAERLRVGRVFLVGDSAHVMPPTGGFGGNICIQDAHNVAWKLAAVLRGEAGPALLDTYHAERHPIAQVSMGEAVARAQLLFAGSAQTAAGQVHERPHHASVALGYRYHSDAVIPDADSDNGLLENPFQPTGRPGTRAPHVVVERNGEQISTLDLFGFGFVLLTGPDGAPWHEAVTQLAGRVPIRLTSYRVGSIGFENDVELLDVENRWADAYGVSTTGAVLVRPDGFIAWRQTAGADRPVEVLNDVLNAVLDTSTELERVGTAASG